MNDIFLPHDVLLGALRKTWLTRDGGHIRFIRTPGRPAVVRHGDVRLRPPAVDDPKMERGSDPWLRQSTCPRSR